MNSCIKIFFVSLVLTSLATLSHAQFQWLVPREGYKSDTVLHHHVNDDVYYHTSDTTVHHHLKRYWPEFQYPGKQFFFQGQAEIGWVGYGAQVVAGYRLGQFGIIGGGVGLYGLYGWFLSNSNTDPYTGYYFPIFVHYEGDILKKWITPYYDIEAGYSFRYANSSNNDGYITVTPVATIPTHPDYKYYGGFTGGVDFGVKFYVRHKVYVTLSATVNIQQAEDKYTNYYYNSIGQNIKISYSSSSFIFTPGTKIACGF